MSSNDRHFARRLITWEITTNGPQSFNNPVFSPYFKMELGEKKIEMRLSAACVPPHDNLVIKSELKNKMEFVDYSTSITSIVSLGQKEIGEAGISLKELFTETQEKRVAFQIQIELMEDSKVEEPPRLAILNNLEKLVNNQKYSDFVFICSDGEKIYVQTSIIAVQCEAFATMIEAGLSEGETKTAKITDVDSETMLELIRYLYCNRVENIDAIQEKLVVAANKYGLKDLKELCVSHLMESLTVENVELIYEIADLLDEDHLMENCIDFMNVHFNSFESIGVDELSPKLLLALWKSSNTNILRLRFDSVATAPATIPAPRQTPSVAPIATFGSDCTFGLISLP